MNFSFQSTLEALILVCALTTDAFVASFAFGSSKIKIPLTSVIVINIVCSAVLGVSLFFGSLIGELIPSEVTAFICFALLLVLGLCKLFDCFVKSLIKKNSCINKELSFNLLNLRFILHIYADPQVADRDSSKVLSPAEAVSLSAAMSLDGLSVGLGAGISASNRVEIVFLSFVIGMIAVMLGCAMGGISVKKLRLDFSWLSGVLLIIIAIMKL